MKYAIFLGLMFSFILGLAQTEKVKNKSIYAELAGAGVAFSANFDQRISKSNSGFGYRVGTGFHLQSKFNQSTTNPGFNKIVVLTIPAQINYVYQINGSTSAIELGVGATYTSKRIELLETDGSNDHLYYNAALMYRRIPKKGNINWRLGLTPFYNAEKFFPSGGLSIGYQF